MTEIDFGRMGRRQKWLVGGGRPNSCLARKHFLNPPILNIKADVLDLELFFIFRFLEGLHIWMVQYRKVYFPIFYFIEFEYDLNIFAVFDQSIHFGS